MSARRQVGQIVARPRSIWGIRHLASDDVRVSVYSGLLGTRGLEAVLLEGLGGQMVSLRLALLLRQVVYAQEMTQSLMLLLV
jgi:hypothetical protein